MFVKVFKHQKLDVDIHDKSSHVEYFIWPQEIFKTYAKTRFFKLS